MSKRIVTEAEKSKAIAIERERLEALCPKRPIGSLVAKDETDEDGKVVVIEIRLTEGEMPKGWTPRSA